MAVEPVDANQGAGTSGAAGNNPASDVTRRDFFGLAWKLVGAVALGQAGYVGLRFMASRQAEGAAGEIVTAGEVDDFPPGTVTAFETVRAYLVRFEDGGFLALHMKCTHLACMVAWNSSDGRFNCPCHGSIFEQDGTVINPPAPRPLDRFAVIIEDGRVRIDTRLAIRREADDPVPLVYAPEPDPAPEADDESEATPSAAPDTPGDPGESNPDRPSGPAL